MNTKIAIAALLMVFCLNACKKNESDTISICYTSLQAYRADSISWEVFTDTKEWQEAAFKQFGIAQALFAARDAGKLDAEMYDWDLSIMNSENIRHNRYDWLDGYDFFMVFSDVPTTDTTECCMKLSVHRGRPYNQNSNSFLDVTDCVKIGDYDSLSKTTVYDKGRACKVALNRATATAVKSGLIK